MNVISTDLVLDLSNAFQLLAQNAHVVNQLINEKVIDAVITHEAINATRGELVRIDGKLAQLDAQLRSPYLNS